MLPPQFRLRFLFDIETIDELFLAYDSHLHRLGVADMRNLNPVKLDQEKLMQFKTLFEEERQHLIASRSKVSNQLQVQPEDLLDRSDLTSCELEASLSIRLQNREAQYLEKIEQALNRIHSNTFGLCEDCESEIELRRLEARPTTTLCLLCKEEQERKELHYFDSFRERHLRRAAISK